MTSAVLIEFFDSLFLAAIPLFVAMNSLGVLPLFISFTSELSEPEKRELVSASTLTCLVLAVVFMVTGKGIFNFMGITEHDFRIGGGIVLLILAIVDLVFSQNETRRKPSGSIGVVPIGIPLIMGPAALTTIIIVVDQYGYIVTLAALLINLMFVWLVFSYSKWFLKVLGTGGAQAFAKIGSLFLAAIAVMMIRLGVTHIIQSTST